MSEMVNVLSLKERCSSEHKQKDIKTAKNQKKVVSPLKEDGIAGHLRSGHGGPWAGRWENGGDSSERYKVRGISTPEMTRVTHLQFEIWMFYGNHSQLSSSCVARKI
jgi:hypothetical protein